MNKIFNFFRSLIRTIRAELRAIRTVAAFFDEHKRPPDETELEEIIEDSEHE